MNTGVHGTFLVLFLRRDMPRSDIAGPYGGGLVKTKAENERYTHLNAEFQRIARRDKAFLSNQCKEIEETNRMGKTRDLFKKIKRYQGNISCKDGLDKGQTWYGPNRSRRH